MRQRTRWAGLALASVCLLSVPSCVTAALWEGSCAPRRRGWSEAEIAGRVLLTPLTLAVDVVVLTAYASAQCGRCCR